MERRTMCRKRELWAGVLLYSISQLILHVTSESSSSHVQTKFASLGTTDGCDPPCENGGVCLATHVCHCPLEFKGPWCQYDKDRCSSELLNTNAVATCSESWDSTICTLKCHQGFQFETNVASQYVCRYNNGTFFPAEIPRCIDAVNEISKHNILSTLETVKSGTCYTWGGLHYRDFNGKIYSFRRSCPYVLVTDTVDSTFTITVGTNPSNCNHESGTCHTEITITVDNQIYILSQDESKSTHLKNVNGDEVAIPGQSTGLSVKFSGSSVVVKLIGVGVTLTWDTSSFLHVDLSEVLWTKVAGLCGRLGGDLEFERRDGTAASSLEDFISSWQADSQQECGDAMDFLNSCTGVTINDETKSFCSRPFHSEHLKQCIDQGAHWAQAMQAICESEHCFSAEKNRACGTLELLIKECQNTRGITGLDWRTDDFCPMLCPAGLEYKSCGPISAPTCFSAVSILPATACHEGCFCPDGLVLHENLCVPRERCPCVHAGRRFASGESLSDDCNTCVCEAGQWKCTQAVCGSQCSIFGHAHVVTFDSRRYDLTELCSYQLMRSGNLSIEVQLGECAPQLGAASAACAQAIRVRVGDGPTLELGLQREVRFEGQILSLPATAPHGTIKVASSLFIVARLNNGVQILWDGAGNVKVDVQASFRDGTEGLCGTFNGNQLDDFQTPSGDVEQTSVAFASKWKTGQCWKDSSQVTNVCSDSPTRRATVEANCAGLKGELFQECHWRVDVEPYYTACKDDACSCGPGELTACHCASVAAYASECALHGIYVQWRSNVSECAITCPISQHYDVCGDSSGLTCRDLSYHSGGRCIEGCRCSSGHALDMSGHCILQTECPCIHEDVWYQAGSQIHRNSTDGVQVLCSCTRASWQCESLNIRSRLVSEPTQPISCDKTKNFEFTNCVATAPVTCQKNFDDKPTITIPNVSTKICQSGCQCVAGTVLDDNSRLCVPRSQCTCTHSGNVYQPGDTFRDDCNTCLCRDGSWDCTKQECPGLCTAWGNSHFKTFDGRIYDFQGSCQYMMAAGSLVDFATFEVTIKNEICGSNGITCMTSVTLSFVSNVSNGIIEFTKNSLVQTSPESRVRESGIFLVGEVLELGITLKWDRGTRVYLKLEPQWKTNVRGLCGNFNRRQRDDFEGPTGSLTEISSARFADSWKLSTECSAATDVIDTCDVHPTRKTWALQKCGVLHSNTFSTCHQTVDVEPYYARCLMDTCGCDQGGDCECLCTAMAAYALECSRRGIHIKWRNQNFCPIQCDENCSNFSPCISACPEETCQNFDNYRNLTKLCQFDTCHEGCQLKQCPLGSIFNSSKDHTCVVKDLCKPVCMVKEGVTYYEGDVTKSDACHQCKCYNGQEECRGEQCCTLNGWDDNWVNNAIPGPENNYVDYDPLTSGYPCDRRRISRIRYRYLEGRPLPEVRRIREGLKCYGSPEMPCPDLAINVMCCCAPCPDPPICGDGMVLRTIPRGGNDCCATYYCHPPQPATCIIEDTFVTTFDNTSFQHDICNHIAAQHVDNLWAVEVLRRCTKYTCNYLVSVTHDQRNIRISDLERIEIDGYRYDLLQAQIIGQDSSAFSISRLGISIVFHSTQFDFTVIYDSNGRLRIRVSENLYDHVFGLCGLFNNHAKDDLTKPDQQVAQDVKEFGNSWGTSVGETCTDRQECLQIEQAQQICRDILTNGVLQTCGDEQERERFSTWCSGRVCECLSVGNAASQCTCDAANVFISQCLQSPNADVLDWRNSLGCPALCPDGRIYRECYTQTCQRSCADIHNNVPCVNLEDVCLTGCFCAEGLVERNGACIKPEECRDCGCRIWGDPHYITFDRKKQFNFQGNCSYIASQDVAQNGNHVYQIITTNRDCVMYPRATCTDEVYIVYRQTNYVFIQRNWEAKRISIWVNGELVTTNRLLFTWLTLNAPNNQTVTVVLKEINLEAFYKFNDAYLTIKMPSFWFGSHTEGLCGSCNGVETDDFKKPDGQITTDSNEFAWSWLSNETRPGMSIATDCNIKIVPPCDEVNENCKIILNKTIFGECHGVVNPTAFVESCHYDQCFINEDGPPCQSIQSYARACQEMGICVNWRSAAFCPLQCAEGFEYYSCHTGCVRSCETVLSTEQCDLANQEGCFCPSDQVLNENGLCVAVSTCKSCESGGCNNKTCYDGHMVGESWNDTSNPCLSYRCSLEGNQTRVTEVLTKCSAKFEERYCVEGTLVTSGCCPKCTYHPCPEQGTTSIIDALTPTVPARSSHRVVSSTTSRPELSPNFENKN